MANFLVEFEGFNDGLPYREPETEVYSTAKEAKAVAEVMRKKYPKVRFRVIQIVEDFRFQKETK
jgi:hypothetical protein